MLRNIVTVPNSHKEFQDRRFEIGRTGKRVCQEVNPAQNIRISTSGELSCYQAEVNFYRSI